MTRPATPPGSLLADRTFAWLIERGQPEGQAPTVYMDENQRPGWYGGWTTDPNVARRFETAPDGEAYIKEQVIPRCRVVEHCWIGGESAV